MDPLFGVPPMSFPADVEGEAASKKFVADVLANMWPGGCTTKMVDTYVGNVICRQEKHFADGVPDRCFVQVRGRTVQILRLDIQHPERRLLANLAKPWCQLEDECVWKYSIEYKRVDGGASVVAYVYVKVL